MVQPYRQQLVAYQARYDQGIKDGTISPIVIPIDIFPAILLFLVLLVPRHRFPTLRYLNIPTFFFILVLEIAITRRCRSMNLAVGYGVGLLSTWSIEWSAALLLFSDPQVDFRRIERADAQHQEPQSLDTKPAHQGSSTSTDAQGKDTHLQRREVVKQSATLAANGSAVPAMDHHQTSFYWQSFPTDSLPRRLDWTADLISNFRGIGWSWQISSLPPPPYQIHPEPGDSSKRLVPKTKKVLRGPTGNHVYLSRADLLCQKLLVGLVGYVVLDFCKVFMMKDPYFYGFLDAAPPSYLPQAVQASAFLTKAYRLLLSCFGVYTALQSVFAIGPWLAIGLLGKRSIGARAEPWMYPDMYGDFVMVLDKGLAGWWGAWWHQTFRFAFSAPSAWIVAKSGMNPHSLQAKVMQLITAFTLSGIVHAGGSYTQIPDTKPITGPFVFFFLQAIGILVQMTIVAKLKQVGLVKGMPTSVRRASNFVYCFIWLYCTAPLLVDDFARGGLWLFEPIPISPLRGLGFGQKGDGWLCWHPPFFWWHQDPRWWRSGIAF